MHQSKTRYIIVVTLTDDVMYYAGFQRGEPKLELYKYHSRVKWYKLPEIAHDTLQRVMEYYPGVCRVDVVEVRG